MSMATIVAVAPSISSRSSTPPPSLSLNTSTRGTPAAIPNKHIPICSPGPVPNHGLQTPPASPPSKEPQACQTSLLHPTTAFERLSAELPVHALNARQLSKALEHCSLQALPDQRLVFPWLHGLHADNHMQLTFFVQRRNALRKIPKCLRSITIVKAGGDLTHSKLKGAIAPDEILTCLTNGGEENSFIDIDPPDGFSVRNFQIQTCKIATVSDVVVYGDDQTDREEVMRLAVQIARCQRAWNQKILEEGDECLSFGTFVLTDSFKKVELKHKHMIALDSDGTMNNNLVDFFHHERLEMHSMSAASEIAPNVYLGPTPDLLPTDPSSPDAFDLYIEASDLAQMPDGRTLRGMKAILDRQDHQPLQMEFPSSGSIMPPTWSHAEADGLLEMCHWIYSIANPDGDASASINSQVDSAGDSIMRSPSPQARRQSKGTPKRVLIHCTDGYTESSLLGLTYFMFAHALPVADAWIQLHRDRNRNFFAYPSDAALLTAIVPRILQESPKSTRLSGSGCLSPTISQDPAWLSRIDGSLPSRILPYMYLGNLTHANNPDMLKELGITRVLSVGEPITWTHQQREEWGEDNLLFVDNIQDNGVDNLTSEFGRCLAFIAAGRGGRSLRTKRERRDSKLSVTDVSTGATLVHCRVGVSRSATICIAEVMREKRLSLPRAYCFVRARRLNVIIQPHLKFMYELLKWEEDLHISRGDPARRELEWATICREIAAMNKPYSR